MIKDRQTEEQVIELLNYITNYFDDINVGLNKTSNYFNKLVEQNFLFIDKDASFFLNHIKDLSIRQKQISDNVARIIYEVNMYMYDKDLIIRQCTKNFVKLSAVDPADYQKK